MKAQITGLTASVEREQEPLYSSRSSRVSRMRRGSGRAEAQVRGTLAEVMRLMGHLTALPGAEHEWCNVTLTIDGDEGLVAEFSSRCRDFALGKRVIPDGSGPKDG